MAARGFSTDGYTPESSHWARVPWRAACDPKRPVAIAENAAIESRKNGDFLPGNLGSRRRSVVVVLRFFQRWSICLFALPHTSNFGTHIFGFSGATARGPSCAVGFDHEAISQPGLS